MAFLWKNLTAEGLYEAMRPMGVSLRLARRLQAVVMRGPRDAWPERMDEARRPLLAQIKAAYPVPHLELVEKVISPRDAFAKYLFRAGGGDLIESVRIPLLHRPGDEKYIVCVSSQVGCSLGCAFCATARLGFRRNLEPWEIVDQVLKICDDSPHPVRGVVFMGMGEPMLNYDAVIRAAEILSESCGPAISAKAITISTAGVVPGIRRFTEERRPYRLVVSLNAADDALRAELMPIARLHPLPELMEAIRAHHRATGIRATLGWTCISGVNTRPADAAALAELTAGLPLILDLIDVNDPSGRFCPPSREELDAFRDALTAELGMPVVRRYSGGQDIAGGCGMLAGRRQ